MARSRISTAPVARALVVQHGVRHRDDIKRGVAHCARAWTGTSQEFRKFCIQQYVPPGKERQLLLRRLDELFHAVNGALVATNKVIGAGLYQADRPSLAAEPVLAAFSPATHLSEDYQRANIHALVQLNFGTDDDTPPRSRAAWAARRLSKVGRQVIPAKLLAERAQVGSEVTAFIWGYNLHLDRITFEDGSVRFPRGTRLNSHWGLRDHMTALTGTPGALPKQRAILDLLRRVVDGEIPADVLDTPDVRWNIPEGTLSRGKRTTHARGHGPLRWSHFRRMWRNQLKIDPYTARGNFIDNKFLEEWEIPEATVTRILTAILASPDSVRVAAYIRDHLGRDLEPFDIYYKDFDTSARKAPLDFDIRKRYPNATSLQLAIPEILERLGWSSDRARWIASHIRVDSSRGAGHAVRPGDDRDIQLLRVPLDRNGCDEISFRTYMHELGHSVECVLSSFEMDYKILWAVPSIGVSEGFAFTFQDRADQILGRPVGDSSDVTVLRRFWEPFELAGVALTEIGFFHWLYEHRNATAHQMMRAVRRLGDEVWDEFYARIFGPEGHGLMSMHSHMLWCWFLMPKYPMGYVIAYQTRKHLADKSLAEEIERMCAVGSIYPQQWMRAAVGTGISVTPLLNDTGVALARLGY